LAFVIMPKPKSSLRRGLTLLGKGTAPLPAKPSAGILETFANAFAHRDYWVRFECADFTSLCPVTGQADFARLRIEYVPGRRCIETKSLKFYLAAYRNTRSFNEEIVNRILDDLVATCQPRQLRVHGEFAARGGISVMVDAAFPAARE
jgi:7-cyano-7-deazaguanine reductase